MIHELNQLEFGSLGIHVKPNLTPICASIVKRVFLTLGKILCSFQRAVHSPLLRKVSSSKNKFLIIITHSYCNLFSLASV